MADAHQSTLAADPNIGPIVPRYVARLPAYVAELRQLMAANNATELQNLLHQLRGTGKSYGFAQLSDLAGIAEDALAAAKPAKEVQTTLDHLIAYIQQIEGFPA